MDVKTLLRQFNLSPKKSLGQNFLIDDHALDQIVRPLSDLFRHFTLLVTVKQIEVESRPTSSVHRNKSEFGPVLSISIKAGRCEPDPVGGECCSIGLERLCQ